MVAHDGIGKQINGEYRAQQFDAIDDPLAAVFEIKTGMGIFTTQECTPHASGDAVVIRCVID